MDISITIDKNDVMTEVYKITGYTGYKSRDIDKISTNEDELKILNTYFEEASNRVLDIITNQCYIVEESDSTVQFMFNLPKNWNNKTNNSLCKSIKQYLVNSICMQWFNLTKKEEVKYYSEKCVELILIIKKHLLERIKPQR